MDIDNESWAPCLHGPDDKAVVAKWILPILNYGRDEPHWADGQLFEEKEIPELPRKIHDQKGKLIKEDTWPARTLVSLDPKITEYLLWEISDLHKDLRLRFYSDQWVAVHASDGISATYVQADDFTLALAKTLEIWRKNEATTDSGPSAALDR